MAGGYVNTYEIRNGEGELKTRYFQIIKCNQDCYIGRMTGKWHMKVSASMTHHTLEEFLVHTKFHVQIRVSENLIDQFVLNKNIIVGGKIPSRYSSVI